MAYDRRGRGGSGSEQVPGCLVDAIRDGREGHHALVQEAWLVVFKRLPVGPYALLCSLALATSCQGGAQVLSVLLQLDCGFGAQSCCAFGKGVDLPDVSVRGGVEG